VPTEHRIHETHPAPREGRRLVRAGVVSLVAGTVIMAAKFAAWLITGSSAILADAAESIVNVVAAAIMTLGVIVAARPADADHPYGHGKAEFLSAAAEGGMILVAATLILVQSTRALVIGPVLRELGTGIVVAGAAGVANLGLALWLIRVGRQERSAAVAADGAHILTDVVTTAGTLVALLVVKWTGFVILDPLVAIAVGLNILVTGWKVIRQALAGLLDEADFELLERIARQLEADRQPEWVEVHQLRAWSSGAVNHVDLHLTVPRYLSVAVAHRVGDSLERRLLDAIEGPGDAVVHLDPCLPRHCPECTMAECPVRSVPIEKPFNLTVDNMTRPGLI
jgi:cation diffusion facilitator family transporter